MCRQYKTVFSYGQAEYDEKRSRFIGQIWNVKDENDAVDKINQVRQEHREARHNVYAYLCRDGSVTGYSDDGEPKGTGGTPILMLLRGMELSYVCCVVTRYFGGILLGTGGLARAYTEAARLAADNAGICFVKPFSLFKLSFGYDRLELFRKMTDDLGGQMGQIDYAADICAEIFIPTENADIFSKKTAELSAGSIVPQAVSTVMKKGERL